ncbi:MAG: hypothetical protein J5379_08605 [Clostridiales bacterium]|nr:hypothetical protein [Clostridiales bacterium]
MHRTQRAWKKAQELGSRDALNCIAELNDAALEEAHYQGRRTTSQRSSGAECFSSGGSAGAEYFSSGRGHGQDIFADDYKAPAEMLLRGVPILVKDNIDVQGMHTTAGSLALSDNVALTDAPVIRNLRRHGAVILGKTNMTEFANYVSSKMPGGYSSRGGQVRHAVSDKAFPGGSSTGSAVAVSAGIVSMAVGTDTSHSIIACAKMNGISGIKPPVGVLSQEGIVPISKTLDSPGPMAETFLDALRMYRAMRDEAFPEVKKAPLGGLRIAVNQASWESVESGEKAFILKVLDRLKEAGTSVSFVSQGPEAKLKTIMKWEFKPMLERYLRSSSSLRKTLAEVVVFYEKDPNTMMKYGIDLLRGALYDTPEGLLGEEYLEALRERKNRIVEVRSEIEDVDAVIVTAPTNVMHFCGLPSVTVPAPTGVVDENGVRRGLIMYGADERRLYAAALAIERLLSV